MAAPSFLAFLAKVRSRFSPPAPMGTDATVTFQNSLPKSGQWNFVSWQQPVVTEYSVTKAEFAYLGKLTLN
jgi:hypothetical protein